MLQKTNEQLIRAIERQILDMIDINESFEEFYSIHKNHIEQSLCVLFEAIKSSNEGWNFVTIKSKPNYIREDVVVILTNEAISYSNTNDEDTSKNLKDFIIGNDYMFWQFNQGCYTNYFNKNVNKVDIDLYNEQIHFGGSDVSTLATYRHNQHGTSFSDNGLNKYYLCNVELNEQDFNEIISNDEEYAAFLLKYS